MGPETAAGILFPFLLILVASVLFVRFYVFVPRRQRKAVAEDVQRRGGRVLDVNPQTAFNLFYPFKDRNTRRWHVRFVDDQGRRQDGLVQTSFWTGLRWISGPFAEG